MLSYVQIAQTSYRAQNLTAPKTNPSTPHYTTYTGNTASHPCSVGCYAICRASFVTLDTPGGVHPLTAKSGNALLHHDTQTCPTAPFGPPRATTYGEHSVLLHAAARRLSSAA